MFSITPACLRGRTRRALLAAALPAVLAAVALPAAADAATVRLIDAGVNGVVSYSAEPGETNAVRVSFTNAAIVIDDVVPIRSLDSRCFVNSAGDGICPGSADSIGVFMGDRNDSIQYRAPHEGFVVGGDGADVIFAGLRQAGFGRQIEPVTYRGKDSVLRGETPDFARDTVTYVFADRAVKVNLADQNDAATSSDGRPDIDREQIESDIEVIEGSNFDDVLLGSERGEAIRGLNGNDVIGAGGGNDVIDEGSAPNGADTISGGTGTGDRVSYGTRTTGGVSVSLDGVRNDGATGEQDNVSVTVESIGGSNFRDVLGGAAWPTRSTASAAPTRSTGWAATTRCQPARATTVSPAARATISSSPATDRSTTSIAAPRPTPSTATRTRTVSWAARRCRSGCWAWRPRRSWLWPVRPPGCD